MCKIVVKYGDLTDAEMEDHRESCEKGAGISWYDGQGFRVIKDMDHKLMYKKYAKEYLSTHANTSPISIFHSRMPSAGAECRENVQPFITEKTMFCHNGTIAKEKLIFSNMARGISMQGFESDSNLLSKLLKGQPIGSIITLLKELDQNFIFASAANSIKNVYIIGRFKYEFVGEDDPTRIRSLRNEFSADKIFLVTDLNGKVQYYEKAPTQVVYYQSKYRGGAYCVDWEHEKIEDTVEIKRKHNKWKRDKKEEPATDAEVKRLPYEGRPEWWDRV